jgi:hypothetical protein
VERPLSGDEREVLNSSCFQRTGGEVANAQVCKTCIRRFDPDPVLQDWNQEKKGRGARLFPC